MESDPWMAAQLASRPSKGKKKTGKGGRIRPKMKKRSRPREGKDAGQILQKRAQQGSLRGVGLSDKERGESKKLTLRKKNGGSKENKYFKTHCGNQGMDTEEARRP